MPDLKGHVAVVTGSTKGIGRSVAAALVGSGCNVAISSRDGGAADQVARELTEAGPGRAVGVACDVRDAGACDALIAAAADAFGRLDILVNNAGIGAFMPVADMDHETWRSVIGTNLDGAFFCTHAALPHLKSAGGGWILNVGSLAGKNAFPGGAAYNASKFGLIGFSEALMQEVRQDDIRVSCIMPGSVATGFNHPESGSKDDWKIQPEDIGRIVLDLLSMPARTLPSRIEVRPSKPPAK